MRVAWMVGLVTFGLPGALRGQAVSIYRRTPTDTLHYREVSQGSLELTTPRGVVPIHTFHDAHMALAFGQRDTVRAWYTTLTISAASPQGEKAPDTRAALNIPFVLRLDSLGHAQTLETPQFPPTFDAVSDLRLQFVDYFVPLPAQPLAPGVTWRDSLILVDSASAGKRNDIRRWGEYRVVGDTVVGSHRAVIVSAIVRLSMRSASSGRGVPVSSELSGTERGQFYWDPVRGRLLGRTRSADLSGTLHMAGGSGGMAFAQRMRYENHLELVE